MAGPGGIGPRRYDQRQYEAAIRRYVVNPLIARIRVGVDNAGDAASALRVLNAAGPGWVLDEEGMTGAVRASGDRAAAAHKDRFVRQFQSALKVDVTPLLNTSRVATYMMRWREENVALIRTIPPRLREQLLIDMNEFLATNPFDRGGLREVVDRGGRSSGFNARRIARDQVNKAVGQFSRMRQTDVGVTRYVWRTSLDERVRPTHADLEGTEQSWDAAPVDGHPGEAIQCRCRAEPVIPPDWRQRFPRNGGN